MRFVTYASIAVDYTPSSGSAFLGADEAQESSAALGVRTRLLESNPVLEAFGNAQTERNDNSSRFGKYMQLQVDFGGEVLGGRINSFLLEKTRVTDFNPRERSFHVFHMLLASARDGELANDLGLSEVPSYLAELAVPGLRFAYVEGLDDDAPLASTGTAPRVLSRLASSMRRCGLQEAELTDIWRLLAAILHLGNVEFRDADGHAGHQRAEVVDDAPVRRCAAALGIASQQLFRALTGHILQGKKSRGSLTIVEHDAKAARRTRDSLARELYKRLFEWLIASVNSAIDANPDCADPGRFDKLWTSDLYIGILDVYGFEIFDVNSFEQFCINYVNEKLQQLFIEQVLKAEQDDYMREGITWTEGKAQILNLASQALQA
mmetsp:Transcript_46401/g.145181  ORF Transcript_46401/g.145181 Transcript_46401/m.145181 type:complete len:378 (-) Transcript_46401:378-1511(-)